MCVLVFLSTMDMTIQDRIISQHGTWGLGERDRRSKEIHNSCLQIFIVGDIGVVLVAMKKEIQK